ncbi:NAD(P)H:quinone oxidoreductase type IV [Marinococcus halophilus]|uniref:NAD(P)H dehydrogenase (Quinone) n=1 Tax=Marinococcus halophilus TaxID=1371 RepID=A0A510Y2H4_MARHA|nr:NAD(P)H:quinone oxidoreductase [Marinococcus halophilus]OZT81548.1 NAD(P)H:quinone oxidoreductase type IV [Marinococcus halophilus]GEK57489.1 NAD(P)H dehydrogenase (quinone) [Marinococcus halophilus]
MSKVLVPFYSAYGHIHEMAKAVAKGAEETGAEVRVVRIPESQMAKEGMSTQEAYVEAQNKQADIPEATTDDLVWADGVVWGIPTRFGNMPAQVKQFMDAAGGLWANGSLEGKVAGIFTSTNTAHGGQETTIITSIVPLLHFGFIFVGLPYGENPEMTEREFVGGTPYGASTLAGPDGTRMPSEGELTMGGRLGARVAKVAEKLST